MVLLCLQFVDLTSATCDTESIVVQSREVVFSISNNKKHSVYTHTVWKYLRVRNLQKLNNNWGEPERAPH